ncbi:MAG: hypothetical protein ABSD08_17325 [Xanthobacteraceae bacterium]|jgi:hypothetical protein
MPLYHTTLFSNDPPGDAFSSRGSAWIFKKESGVYTGPQNEVHEYSMKLFRERGHAPTGNYMSDEQIFFDMEVLIQASGGAQAQQAANMLVSAIAVLAGC